MVGFRRKFTFIQFLVATLMLISLTACSLSFAEDVTPPPQPTAPVGDDFLPEPTPLADQSQSQAENQPTDIPKAVDNISVSGKVFMVGGGNVPEGLTADLQRFQMTSIQPELLGSIEVQDDGSFHFDGISLDPDQVMIITVDYNRATFLSQMVAAAGLESGETVDLPVEIYQTTSDTSTLVAERAHFYFDLIEKERLQVLELFIISNPSNFYILPPQAGAALIDFALPEGAENLQFEDQSQLDRFRITSNGFSDLESIPPGGQSQIVFAYELPFESTHAGGPLQWFGVPKKTLSIPLPVAVQSAMVMAPSSSLQLINPRLVEAGTRTLQGMSIQVYTASNLQAGSNFELTIKGRHPSGFPGGASGINLAIGFIVFAFAVAVAAYWVFRKPKALKETAIVSADHSGDAQDAILDSILALDDLYTSGKIAPEPYQKRRAELKEQLRSLRHEHSD